MMFILTTSTFRSFWSSKPRVALLMWDSSCLVLEMITGTYTRVSGSAAWVEKMQFFPHLHRFDYRSTWLAGSAVWIEKILFSPLANIWQQVYLGAAGLATRRFFPQYKYFNLLSGSFQCLYHEKISENLRSDPLGKVSKTILNENV